VVDSKGNQDVGRLLKQRRLIMSLTLRALAAKSSVSASHLGRIERGARYPSVSILRKIARHLGLEEGALLQLAGHLSAQPNGQAKISRTRAQLDPFVKHTLAQETVEVQRTVIGIISLLKSIADAKGQSDQG
jgi:transcriptional regulator with XRE-family HTH domain